MTGTMCCWGGCDIGGFDPRSCGERSSGGGVLHNTGAPRGKTPSMVMFWSWMFQFISLPKWFRSFPRSWMVFQWKALIFTMEDTGFIWSFPIISVSCSLDSVLNFESFKLAYWRKVNWNDAPYGSVKHRIGFLLLPFTDCHDCILGGVVSTQTSRVHITVMW